MVKKKLNTIYKILYIIISCILSLGFIITIISNIINYDGKEIIFLLYFCFHLMGISISVLFLGINIFGIILYKKPIFIIFSILMTIWVVISSYYWISGRIMVMM